MSMNNKLWNEVDVRDYCFKRMQELQKEKPVNGVALERYMEDFLTAAKGTRTFTVSTCEMLKDLIRTKLVLLQESCATNLESETPVYVTEVVRVAEIFCNSHSQEGGAEVSGKTVGKKAENFLNLTMRVQNVMAREKALFERESALAAREKALLTRDPMESKDARPRNVIGGDERRSSTHDCEDTPRTCRRCPEPVSEECWYCTTHAFENGLIPETCQDEHHEKHSSHHGSRGGQRQSKIFADLANESAHQYAILGSEPRKSSTTLRSPPTSADSEVAPPQIPSRRKIQTPHIESVAGPGQPKCRMQSKDSRKSSMSLYIGLQSAFQASEYERLYQAESPSLAILCMSATPLTPDEYSHTSPVDVGSMFNANIHTEYSFEEFRQEEFIPVPGTRFNKGVLIRSNPTILNDRTLMHKAVDLLDEVDDIILTKGNIPPAMVGVPPAGFWLKENVVLPKPAKNPNWSPFEWKLLEEYTRRVFAAHQLEIIISPVASSSHVIAKPVFFEQEDACIARGEDLFQLDRLRSVVNYMPVNKAVQMMTYPGMTIDQALRIIGRHSWMIISDLLITTSKIFEETCDQGHHFIFQKR